MTVHDNVLDAVGRTPLVRLNRIVEGLSATVLVKLEYLNPGGSVKDRAARSMVLAAEASGELAPGATIVEATSGNTGIGLAQAAAVTGHPLIVVVPDKTAVEKIDLLRAYGVRVVVTGGGHPRSNPEHVFTLAERITEETPGAWLANQYDNPANPAAHRESTGPEIWADTAGRITHFVSGIGTGGTITGTGEHLKEVSGGAVQVIGVDPTTSVYSGGDGSPFFVEAAGHYLHPENEEDIWPESYHPETVDEVVAIDDREAILVTRRLAVAEGLLLGGSAGLAVAGALRIARDLGPEHTVVVLAPDSGRAYLSKYHSVMWLRQFGFLDDDRQGLLAQVHPAGLAAPSTVTPQTSVRQALEVARTAGEQPFLPVVLARADRRFATAVSEILGSVDAVALEAAAALDPEATVATVLGPVPFPVGSGETPAEASARWTRAGDRGVLLRDGRLAAVITRAQLTDPGRTLVAAGAGGSAVSGADAG